MRANQLSIAVLAVLAAGSAHAWPCSYWSQSTDPNAECYKAPVTPGGNATATQNQGQGQTQGQIAQGGNATGGNGYGGQGGQGGAGGKGVGIANSTSAATAAATASSAASNNGSNVALTNDYQMSRIPVATAFAAALTSGQCGVGSTSAGVQTPVVGVSFGTTRQAKEAKEYCRRFDAIRVAFMISPVVGCHDAILVLPDIKAAMDAAGMTCELVFNPPPPPPVVEAPPPPPPEPLACPPPPPPVKHHHHKPAPPCPKP